MLTATVTQGVALAYACSTCHRPLQNRFKLPSTVYEQSLQLGNISIGGNTDPFLLPEMEGNIINGWQYRLNEV